MTITFSQRRTCSSSRHTTSYLEAGPPDGPLMVFLHGWPALGAIWSHQLEHFAAEGWRCIAPDLRGYGNSSAPSDREAYALTEIVQDMVELHDASGAAPAVWVGHDWGSEVVWSLLRQEAHRVRGAVGMVFPHLPDGFTFTGLLPLVNRSLYPDDRDPLGQWDYVRFDIDEPDRVAADFEADVDATLIAVYRAGDPDSVGRRATTADVRSQGGWFGDAHRAPQMPRDEAVLSEDLLATLGDAFRRTGFAGPNAWYRNVDRQLPSRGFDGSDGRNSTPVLFLHALLDRTDDTLDSPLANPMRLAFDRLTEIVVPSGHWTPLERPDDVTTAIGTWLVAANMVTPGRAARA